jgi:hypothetical protein
MTVLRVEVTIVTESYKLPAGSLELGDGFERLFQHLGHRVP